MLSKAIVTLVASLAATSGVAWVLSEVCQAEEQSNRMVVDSGITTAEKAPAAKVVSAYPKLTFASPVEFTYANDGTNRVFVIEQEGRIRVFENNANTASAGTYLDIRKKVTHGGEMGLLGLAFHPDFKQNGYFYVNYTKNNPRETIVSRFKAKATDAMEVDPASEVILFRFDQPFSNHNGGKVLFGPDGYLYVSTGDGGSGGDPHNNGQNRSSWLGKILRVDVNSTEKGHYGIPKDNPFKGNSQGYREEIFAYGLRNPWRVSFDEQGRLWAGDVGQDKIEEVDIITKGGNYGWRVKEANADYNAKDNAVNEAELVSPIWQYSHSNGDVSITGGVVYRGSSNPALRGKYIYGDYASGRVWALTPKDNKTATNQEIIGRAGTVSAFGEDQKHELYLCDYATGKIMKITAD